MHPPHWDATVCRPQPQGNRALNMHRALRKLRAMGIQVRTGQGQGSLLQQLVTPSRSSTALATQPRGRSPALDIQFVPQHHQVLLHTSSTRSADQSNTSRAHPGVAVPYRTVPYALGLSIPYASPLSAKRKSFPTPQVLRHSSLYETSAAYVTNQPSFLNAAILARTSLRERELLKVTGTASHTRTARTVPYCVVGPAFSQRTCRRLRQGRVRMQRG